MDKNLDRAETMAETVVGPSVKIQGDFNSEGNIRIEGQVHGTVKTTKNVFVGESATITADILAGNCVIGGVVQGNIKVSGNLTLSKTAQLSGDITCAVLSVEEGAAFNGKCNMNATERGSAKHSAEPEPEN